MNTASGIFVTPVAPNAPNHEIDAGSAYPRLHSIPDAGHGGSIENGPQGTPDTERCAIDDGKGDVVYGTDTTGEADEACRDGVAKLHIGSESKTSGGKPIPRTQTHIQLCHHESPSAMLLPEIIHVLILKESAACC